jgi:4-carboxymuconolactone decarboxylase
MTRIDYATEPQLAELIRQCGLPENTPRANAFRIFAHSPAVGAATLRLVFALLTETNLDPVLRELVILRVAQRCECRYAWVQHVAIARGAGIGDPQIAALERAETAPALFNDRELTAFRFVDEVLDTCHASDRTFAMAQALFSSREIVELVLLIGYFRMICGAMTTLAVEVESPFGEKILDSLRDSASGQGMSNRR